MWPEIHRTMRGSRLQRDNYNLNERHLGNVYSITWRSVNRRPDLACMNCKWNSVTVWAMCSWTPCIQGYPLQFVPLCGCLATRPGTNKHGNAFWGCRLSKLVRERSVLLTCTVPLPLLPGASLAVNTSFHSDKICSSLTIPHMHILHNPSSHFFRLKTFFCVPPPLFNNDILLQSSVLVAVWSKAWVCSRSIAAIAGSNSAEGVDIHLLYLYVS